ncbi:MAG: polyphosphate polymerase domain-containing protein [Anaerolineaceae bacterium]|nr:polyphosphate polymerase domain-containing protein [Anaerolineaceae bacterium]
MLYNKRFRNEWKFRCDQRTRISLYERLRPALNFDEHSGPDGSYAVHSLYFDDLTDSCARENEAGTEPRAKYRVRCYGADRAMLHLERKEKNYGLTRKLSCPLEQSVYMELIAGNAPDVYWNAENDLLRRFCLAVMNRGFRPKLSLSYQRAALIEPALNVRVTFDSAIQAADAGYGFPTPEGSPVFPLIPESETIVEVKFDDILPGWLHKIIESVRMQWVPFSKYYLGRKKLEEIYR